VENSELFKAAKKRVPAIIFIDKIDAMGGARKLKDQLALKMTLNNFLVQLDEGVRQGADLSWKV